MTQTANAPLLRLMNAETVLDAVRRLAPISRADIARETGMVKPTVSNALQALLDAGLVREAPPTDGRLRQRGNTFEPVPEAAFIFGLDVGGENLRGALVDLDGQIRAREEIPHNGLTSRELSGLATELRDRLLDQVGIGIAELGAAVVGVPGVVNPADGTVWRLNPERVESVQIVQSLQSSLGHAVRVENDINLAAVGERFSGLASGVDDLIFLSVGTGVGAGLILRGDLYRGAHGAAGEIDMPHDPASPAAHALLTYARERHGLAASSPEEVFAAASEGSKAARAVMREEARRIAECIIPMVRTNDVELVVLGGGIGVHCHDVLEDIEQHLLREVHYPPRVQISSLGSTSVLAGALALGLSDCTAGLVQRQLGANSGEASSAPQRHSALRPTSELDTGVLEQ